MTFVSSGPILASPAVSIGKLQLRNFSVELDSRWKSQKKSESKVVVGELVVGDLVVGEQEK